MVIRQNEKGLLSEAWFCCICGSGGSRTLVQTLGNNAFYILSLLLDCRVEAGQRQPTTTVSFGVSPKLKGVVCGYSCDFGVQAASYKKKPTAGQMVLIPGIRQPLHRSILRLQKLKVRINVSYKQHTVCLHCFLGAVKTGRTQKACKSIVIETNLLLLYSVFQSFWNNLIKKPVIPLAFLLNEGYLFLPCFWSCNYVSSCFDTYYYRGRSI